MNRLNLEKTAEAAAAAKGDRQGQEKQDVGKEKDEAELLDSEPEQIRQMNSMSSSLLVVNGGSSESPLVLSDGMSQSETETQSTIIVTNKGMQEGDKTPVAEKPFEHLEPSKNTRGRGVEEDGSDTETGTGDDEEGEDDDNLSDLDDLDIEESPVKMIEPPRVEIEDEFGGVTLAVDVDNEIDESVKVGSSDSLNSGVFLETEMSDWAKDGGHSETGEGAVKDNNNRGKRSKSGRNKSGTTAPVIKSHLALELDDMDFMDGDGLSSPEDPQYQHQHQLVSKRRQEGYSKLGTEVEESEDSLPPGFSVVLRTTQPHDEQPSPNTLERQQRPTYSSDEQDESGRSSTPTVESCSKPQQQSKVPLKPVAMKGKVVEAVNQVLVKEVGKLDKVVPFHKARDSLDHRKSKGAEASPVKSKDLYSTYCLPSVKGDLLEEHEMADSLSSPTSSTSSSKLKGSPEMARKIEEIHKERAKQNDLIRSMVMGRIRKSPEKNSRRGSRGSLSPLGGGSSSGSSGNSASGSNEQVLRCGDHEVVEVDSRRSSQNSILSHSDNSSAAEPILAEVNKHHQSASSSQYSTSGEGSIPHQKLVKTSSTSTPSESLPATGLHEQPHFHSNASPRFRRPKFDTPLSVYQSVTNPPTPVNPSVHTSVVLTPGSEASSSEANGIAINPTESTKSMKMLKSHSPSFYRSMPDLSAFLVTSSSPSTHPGGVVVTTDLSSGEEGFATPNVKQWENYKQGRANSNASSVDREKARQAARERARLKSDEELGLSPTDYANLKEKVRRKASVPESDEVFVYTKPGSVPNTPVRESLRGQGYIPPSRRLARPMSDVFDAAFAIRPNVDFPITKMNPFLVSPTSPAAGDIMAGPAHHSLMLDNGGGGEWFCPLEENQPNSDIHPHHHRHLPEEEQGFAHMKLRMSSSPGRGPQSERKISPEKSKSMGWSSNDVTLESMMPNYFSTAAPTTPPTSTSRTPLSLTPRADGNWFFDKPSNGSPSQQGSHQECSLSYTRPRSNTLSDLNLSPASLHSGNLNCHGQAVAAPAPQYQSTTPTSNEVHVTKAKALSTDTLLDAGDDSDSPGCAKGVSVPDIARSVANDSARNHKRVSPERKRKSKDRDRRRSLIQAVSDFFTSRGSSSSGSGAASQNVSPSDKSNSGSSGSAVPHTSSSYEGGDTGSAGGSKEKFSLFKLTPKILQSAKDRRNSKSRENIMSPPPPAPRSPPAAVAVPMIDPNNPPPKPARAAFSTYLSQPEMVIQRLTSSPTTYKSNRGSSQGRMLGFEVGDESSLAGTVDHLATLSIVASPAKPARTMRGGDYHHNRSRIREIQEIQLQLESVEAQQRSLEARGVAVEKKIRGEEPDEKQRDESELMEEWFTLVREKTRLARFEKELLVRAEELELEARKERLEEQLDNSLLMNDEIKSSEEKGREIELLHELRAVEEQRGKLLTCFQDDMRQYENEDADLEAKIASSRLSPKESNV